MTSTALLQLNARVSGAVLSSPLIALSDKIGPCTRGMARMLAKMSPRLGVEPIDLDKLSHDKAWGM